MASRPRNVTRLALDVAAVLFFAMFTLAMATAVAEVESGAFRIYAVVLTGVGLYFVVRGSRNARTTWRDRTSAAG